MADIELVIKIPREQYSLIMQSHRDGVARFIDKEAMMYAIKNGTPLTPDILADLLMEKRIMGELKQDISYSKDIIDDVRCKLTVDIIDYRPCYCGSELREVWREKK